MFGGGFGQNNQQSSGFGAGSGFGGTSSGGGFGSTSSLFGGGGTTSGGGLFGNTSSSFGSGGGFGAGAGTQNQTNSLFGGQNRPGGFGAGTGTSTGGSLFGSGAGTAAPTTGGSGFGGFGSATNTGGAFGSAGTGAATTGGGLFGNKTGGGFGSSAGTGSGFGTSGGAGGFGSTSSGFGSGTGTAFQQAVPPSDGTGSTPFSAFTEKDNAANATNHYQSISFMQPYSKYSFEELRLGDYNQGRRFGNGSGQAGAFGSSAFGGSGFGQQQQQSTGFGSTSSPFGGATSAPSTFGQTQTTGAFGSNSTNPLFGAAKPATSLFGGGAGTTGTSQPGGLFGGTGATANAGGFGSSAGTGTGTGTGGFGSGGSLFGNSNNAATPNKPLFGSGTGTTGSAFGGGGFGTQNTSAASPFGGTAATSSPFGGQQQQQQTQPQTGTGLFGGGFGQQNQAQPQTQNKGLFGGGFGANTQQQPPTTPSLFGNTGTGTGTGTGAGTTGSSLFGQNAQQPQQQPAGGSLFGGNNQQTGTSSLFGGAQQQGQKSLFGGSATGTGTGTGGFGGFGNAQGQQPGGGLFGGAQNQQQQKPSLFGSTPGGGGSLFGGSNTAAPSTGGSLFGNTQSQPQPAGGLGTSSLFGSTQQAQPQQMQPQQPVPGSLQASLLDGNPYGNQSIFSGLPAPSASSPGPLATPLSSSTKQKQRTPLPVYKITPNAANRLITPPKRQGYGFSYSTYGSPSSSTGTPSGLGSSLLGGSMRASVNGGSLGRASFSKSFSTSNLRKTFDPDTDSVLSPGALTSGSSRLSSGSLKRLTIDRSLRNDLFARPASTPVAPITNGEETPQPVDKMKKKVSFDASSEPSSAGAEIVPIQAQSSEPTPEELGFLRSIRKSGTINGISNLAKSTENDARPEMESVRGNELTAVPEDAEQTAKPTDGPSRLAFTPGADPQPGNYWMKPSRAEINKLSREQQKKFVGFTVGRERCGQVTFDEPVDLTTVELDRLFDRIVDIGVRKITVYPDETIKPPMGKGLNVPSTLRIENSWPRGRDKKSPSPLTSGPLFDKHVDRLVKVHNTEFVDYETETGTWVFRVPHYTTYGLDYDSDEEEEGESLNQSTLSAAPDTPTPKNQTPGNADTTMGSEMMSGFSTDDSFVGSMAGVDDDTFDFKKRKIVPGAFGNQVMETMEDEDSGDEESFLGEGSTGSTIEQDGDDITESQQSGESVAELDEGEEMDMAGTFPDLHRTVERDDTESVDTFMETTQPVLRPWDTPSKARLDLNGDWAEHLQRTISPRKQNRDALREIQANAFTDRPLFEDCAQKPASSQKKGFATSIDLMNSLFQQPRKQAPSPLKTQIVRPEGLEWPYNKKPKTFAGESHELSADDRAFHHSFKPRWGSVNSILCARNEMGGVQSGNGGWQPKFSVTSEGRDVSLLEFNKEIEPSEMLDAQRKQSAVSRVDGVPFARLATADFRQFTQASNLVQSDHERLLWQLANILFNDDVEDDISAGVPPQLRGQYRHRIKKDRLSRLWEGIAREKHAQAVARASSAEERAVYLLCSHRIDEACKVLVASHNYHLATLVAQIGRDPTTRADMAKQIEMWRQSNVYSEMTEPVRALYELLAGNALRSDGKLTGALEDRVSELVFSTRFELDWFQAFGLRLWYGTMDDEPLEAAVSRFVDDLSNGGEPAFPSPHGSVSEGSSTADTLGRESPLWVLLKVYAATVGAQNSSVPAQEFPAALLPESVSGDKLSNRLSFQLCQLLAAVIGRHESFQINTTQLDQLVWDYAWELCCSGALGRTLFVLLHLSRASDRERAVKETLARFAPELPDPVTADGQPSAMWRYLTQDLQLPEGWLWVAKALYARDTGDAAREVDYLVRAKNWNDAHATFCRIVGPTAVIEGDFATLEILVTGFGEEPERKVRGWASGGGIYDDFLRLATAKGKRDSTRLSRLVQALVTMGDKISQAGVEGLEERVAFREMSRAVAGWTAHEEQIELSSVLSLPLTGDARVAQTAEMSRRYYRTIMAGGY